MLSENPLAACCFDPTFRLCHVYVIVTVIVIVIKTMTVIVNNDSNNNNSNDNDSNIACFTDVSLVLN